MVEGSNNRSISSDFDVRQPNVKSSALMMSTPASINSDDEKTVRRQRKSYLVSLSKDGFVFVRERHSTVVVGSGSIQPTANHSPHHSPIKTHLPHSYSNLGVCINPSRSGNESCYSSGSDCANEAVQRSAS